MQQLNADYQKRRSGDAQLEARVYSFEFGRTPTVELPTPGSNEGKVNGRDHNHYGFCHWLAGDGVQGGYVHATILHPLGFDHEELTCRYAGRDFRLTEVHDNVVK